MCLFVVGRKVWESSAVGPSDHTTLAKGPDPTLAHGPNKKLLLYVFIARCFDLTLTINLINPLSVSDWHFVLVNLIQDILLISTLCTSTLTLRPVLIDLCPRIRALTPYGGIKFTKTP